MFFKFLENFHFSKIIQKILCSEYYFHIINKEQPFAIGGLLRERKFNKSNNRTSIPLQ